MSKDDHEDLKQVDTLPRANSSPPTRALDLRTDEEKKLGVTELQRLQKRDREIESQTRCLLLAQAIQFILNSRKALPTPTGNREVPTKPDTMINATLSHAQWAQIEELIEA